MQKTLITLATLAIAPAAFAGAAGLTVTVNPGSAGTISLTNVSGFGSAADPLIIEENWFGTDLQSTIDIRGARAQRDAGLDPANTPFTWSIFVQKRVTNNSGQIWSFYDNELQQIIGVPSGNGDGLSFAQGLDTVRPYTSNIFNSTLEEIDDRDFLNFRNGIVNPGETVVMNFVISDNTPDDIFHLRQRPNFVPTPGALAALLFGGGLALRRRR